MFLNKNIKTEKSYNYLTQYLPAITEFSIFGGHPNVQCHHTRPNLARDTLP